MQIRADFLETQRTLHERKYTSEDCSMKEIITTKTPDKMYRALLSSIIARSLCERFISCDGARRVHLSLIDYVTDTTIYVLECQVIYYSSLFPSGKMVTNDHVNRCSIHLANNAHNWSAARSK